MKITTLIPLYLFVLLSFGCKKEKSPEKSTVNYSAKLNGTRKWHGTSHGWVSGLDSSQTHNTSNPFDRTFSDSSVFISVSGTTLGFWNMTLQLDSTNSTNHTMFYSGDRVNQNIYCRITYYYEADSIYCDYTRNDGHAGVTYIKMRTP